MRISKSTQDITIPIRYSCDAPDINCNFIVTTLTKSKPCHKITHQDGPNAYDLVNTMRFQTKQNINIGKNYEIPSYSKTKKKRAMSQEELQQLILIQDQIKTLAFQSLCSKAPVKCRALLKVTARQLAQLQANTMSGRSKRPEMVKKVMANAMQKYKVPQKCKSSSISSINDSFPSLQNLSNIQNVTGSSTFKSSFSEDEPHQKLIKLQKAKYFEKKITDKTYQQIYNMERRKQAWKGYLQAQRNRTVMLRPDYIHSTKITFGKDPTKKRKKGGANKGKDDNNQDDDQHGYYRTLKSFKQFQDGFQAYSSQYKLKLK